MKKIAFIIGIGVISLSFQEKKQEKGEQKVYICNSVSSARYHYHKNCRGLSKCKSNIKVTTKKKAEKFGRTLCEIEKKKKKKVFFP